MLVVDCLLDRDDRAFPYLWNVPVIRMDSSRLDRIGEVASMLLDEVLRNFLWEQRTDEHRRSLPRAAFTPRPPELMTVATLPDDPENGGCFIVYPDPPLGSEEKQLFANILPNVRIATLTEWLVEVRLMMASDIAPPRNIAVSISESPDMAMLGFSEDHLREAMADFAIQLLASGATLAYGATCECTDSQSCSLTWCSATGEVTTPRRE